MQTIPKEQVIRRIASENPWWSEPHKISQFYGRFRPRRYSERFLPLVQSTSPRRAVLLMGPRRVGKTVLIHHVIERLLAQGVNPRHVCYVSVDHPIYNGCALDHLLNCAIEASGTDY